MGFKFSWRNGEIVRPTNEELIADALAAIKDGLSHIKDPHVWDGYPDGWSPGDEGEEGDLSAPVGLFLNLERCTRSDSTWQMAMAIETAFALGKFAEGGRVDLAALQRLYAAKFAQSGGNVSGPMSKAAANNRWRAEAQRIWWEMRGQFPEGDNRRSSQTRVAKKIEETVKRAPDRDYVKKTISKWDRDPPAATLGGVS
jgi:hypothetical protein